MTRGEGLLFCRGAADLPDGWVDVEHGQTDAEGFRHFKFVGDEPPRKQRGRKGTRGGSRRSAGKSAPPKVSEPSPTSAPPAKSDRYDPLHGTENYRTYAAEFAVLWGRVATTRPRLAAQLFDIFRLPPEAFTDPEIGCVKFNGSGSPFSFVEKDGDGNVIAVHERCLDRQHKRFTDSDRKTYGPRGLFYPPGIQAAILRERVVYVVEGVTDTVAGNFAGMPCVGRPSAKSGADHLIVMLKKSPADVRVVLVGEYDPKFDADGTLIEWPGKEGAEQVAAQLAAALPHRVYVTMMPAGPKDTRADLTDELHGDRPYQERGAELRAKLDAAAVPVTPSSPLPAADGAAAPGTAGPYELGDLAGEPVRDQDRDGDGGDPPKGVKPTDYVFRCVRDDYELFTDGDGTAYAALRREPIIAEEIGSGDFGRLLNRWYQRLIHEIPGGDAIKTISSALAAVAAGRDPQPVHIRTAYHAGKVYVHAARDLVYEIDGDGWRECKRPPVRFRWPKNSRAMPVPVAGGSIDELRPFANLEDAEQFPLLVAWLTAVIRGGMPIPGLLPIGTQGSSKSTFSRFLVRLVDPRTVELRRQPAEVEDLAIAARNAWLPGYDNVSHLEPDMADAICTLITGGSLTRRTKYTDSDESAFTARRPIILNGIDEPSPRGDFLERMLLLRLRPIDEKSRRAEEQVDAAFGESRPIILGALFDFVSRGLRNQPSVRADLPIPRMADFARWTAAVAGEDVVTHQLAGVGRENARNALDAHPLVPPLLNMLSLLSYWRGTPTELYDAMTSEAQKGHTRGLPANWPKAAHTLRRMLDRIAPALEQVEAWKMSDHRTATRREIIFERVRPRVTDTDL